MIVMFYRCPFRMIFKMNCPGCGMTRALLSALRFDFQSAFRYHPLFLLVGFEIFYVVFYEWIQKKFRVNAELENAVLIVSIMLLLIVWIIRQFII